MDDDNSTIYPNPYPWNARANMLFIEMPAGVGYSVAGDDKAWKHNDYSTSVDNIVALEDFFTKFDGLRQHDIYIAGESYGGIYVPYLTW